MTKEQKAEISHIKKAIDQIDSINKGLIKTKPAEIFLDELYCWGHTWIWERYKKLPKNYASLKEDLLVSINSLKDKTIQGTHLGRDCYKIRLGISSKGKGKSGGARIIAYIAFHKEKVFLLSIYDKSEKETLTIEEIRSLIDAISFKNLN